MRVFLSGVSDPSQLLEAGEANGVAELGFEVVSVASAGGSDFLPDVYRDLYMPRSNGVIEA